MRGKPNYPNYVKYVAEALAGLRGMSTKQVAEISGQNYEQLFNR